MSPETGKRPPETQNVDAQTTFTLEITVGMRKLSRKTASNLQCGKYQDLIRGSLNYQITHIRIGLVPISRLFDSFPESLGSSRLTGQPD